jgi:hypothetical protein
MTWSCDAISGLAHRYSDVIPNSTGTSSSAISGKVRAPDSSSRRVTTPHLPPTVWCNSNMPNDPILSPRQYRYAYRYDRKNWPGSTNSPIAVSARNTTPMIRAIRCNRSSRGPNMASFTVICVSPLRRRFPFSAPESVARRPSAAGVVPDPQLAAVDRGTVKLIRRHVITVPEWLSCSART